MNSHLWVILPKINLSKLKHPGRSPFVKNSLYEVTFLKLFNMRNILVQYWKREVYWRITKYGDLVEKNALILYTSVFHHAYEHSGPLNARLRNSRLLYVQTSYRRVPLSIVLAVLMSYKSPYAKESLLG